MGQEELAGYTVLSGYVLMVVMAVKVFGLRRVLAVVFGIVLIGVSIAFGTLRGLATRR